MGEIGISRHEFLYEIRLWEVRRILRGYNRRNLLLHRLLRIAAYGSFFGMRDPKGKTPEEWLPLPFDKECDRPPISQDEQKELLDLIEAENKRIEESQADESDNSTA